MTAGQKLLKKALSDLQWAQTLLDESQTPEVLSVDRLLEDIRTALTTRKAERIADRGDTR